MSKGQIESMVKAADLDSNGWVDIVDIVRSYIYGWVEIVRSQNLDSMKLAIEPEVSFDRFRYVDYEEFVKMMQA